MSRIRLSLSKRLGGPSVSINAERMLKQATRSKWARQQIDETASRTAETLRLRAQQGWDRMLKATDDALGQPGRHGLTNIGSPSGDRNYASAKAFFASVQIRGLDGKFIRVPLGRYKQLTPDYIRRRPRSRQFWKKNGDLWAYYGDMLQDLGGKRVQAKKTLQSQGNGRFRSSVNVLFPRISRDSRVDAILRGSFVDGQARRSLAPPSGVDRQTVSVLLYPEHFRPLVGKISAVLGTKTKEHMRKSPFVPDRKGR